MPAGSVLGEGLLPGSGQQSSHYGGDGEGGGERERSSSYKATNPIRLEPTIMTSFYPHYLLEPSLHTATQEVRASGIQGLTVQAVAVS